ncbi:MAG: NAD(P)H-hydrate dehydratase [Prolixibacteraceae bacterium]|jgi:ADP-dependent NAD(P)H-hydrate dehydratase / NAD(P)H-hydrate epimerase|nr:NAD(P)H-hydrate dehydratase [Prolixibacteraceae bacterium]MBT6004709.1 NAD(P)H-hydrate dehydratase [Prolixibacteraceae bacterium]MBT6766067.1 NAD(P)H-hydrate dehydratase [Prolixibacteraceae bacterium]MBT6997240.1 NAD(P)H-hydrate dehydratase [Prolixibacteraceae bacterium]MBT7396878.1 NAD(P)H-hydrate dehydratase [Prolixibacteraceae bacterium]
MKLFSTKQISELDKYTIENEPIADIDLMERAATQITNWWVQKFSTEQKIIAFAGAGNNGGDALAIVRQLAELDYVCEIYLLDLGKDIKSSPAINWQRLLKQSKVKLSKITSKNEFPKINNGDVILDGMFGSGLTRALEGFPAEIINQINQLKNTVVSIDIPSGLKGEDNTENIPENIIKADFTLTFQFPKISFLFAENEKYVGNWEMLPIGLHPDGIAKIPTDYFFIEKADIHQILPKRSQFAHKGTFGHALLIAGSYGKMGAAILASKACLRAGVGLLTSHVPRLGYSIIQTAVPEAMASVDQHDSMFTEFPDLKTFSAIGIGPGLNQKHNSCSGLCSLLEASKVPLVIDADALNILSENKDWLEKLPENSILTPHPGEFRRLVSETKDSFENIQKQIQFSKKYKVVIVLKGAFTSISTPEGKLFFNSTGNPGMATAGSGDILTGIILGLLAQGFSSKEAALAGVFLHGMAGDFAAQEKSEFSLIARDLIDYLGKSFLTMNTDSTK